MKKKTACFNLAPMEMFTIARSQKPRLEFQRDSYGSSRLRYPRSSLCVRPSVKCERHTLFPSSDAQPIRPMALPRVCPRSSYMHSRREVDSAEKGKRIRACCRREARDFSPKCCASFSYRRRIFSSPSEAVILEE